MTDDDLGLLTFDVTDNGEMGATFTVRHPDHDFDIVVAVCKPSTWRRSPYYDAMELTTLAVHPQWRRRGIGTRTVRLIFDWAAERGSSMTMVTAHADNAKAIAFYESLGLRPHYVTFDNYQPEPSAVQR